MNINDTLKTDLLDSPKVYDVLYHESPEMFLSVCPKTATIINCNNTICRKTGYERAEVLGMSIYKVYDLSCHRRVESVFTEFLINGEIQNIELIVKKKDGSTFPILLSSTAIKNEKGDVLFSNSCWRDITLIKNLENSLMQSNKLLNFKVNELAQKNKELEQFAYIVSHDLNTPLRNIKGVVQLMKEDKDEEIPNGWDSYFNYISQSVSRMGRLINTILDFSQLGVKSEKEYIDTHKILNNVLEDFTLAIDENKVQIYKTILPQIQGYAVEFHMLLQNLIGNAIKFQSKDVIPIIKIGATNKGNEWVFYVKDNGIGIQEKHKEKIFSFFKRMNEDYRGTGIGLAQCKKIVNLHSGRIWVENNELEGSCFYFSIPNE